MGGLAATWYWERVRRRTAERLAAATLETLMYAIDANDQVTGQHVRRTATYALCLGEALGLSKSEQRALERVALFHDIGKIHAALFDIVHEPSRLTPEEKQLVATHAERGAEVLQPLAAFYPELPRAVLAHHERWDGRGYPHGMSGDAIPLHARVVAIADTFDAITHSRRYHHGEGFDRGVAVIGEGRGSQFDPALVDVFLSPQVLANVRRNFELTAAQSSPALPAIPKDDRRAEGPGPLVPDVQFRWRAPSAVAPADADPRGEQQPAAG